MGEQVLKRLEFFVDIEGVCNRDGLIAGQAVASAVSELYGTGNGVIYNDVDVFRNIWQGERKSQVGRVLEMSNSYETGFKMDYGQLDIQHHFHYNVSRTRRNELLNEVLCTSNAPDFLTGPNEARRFIASFDLNCVQVGVDIESRQLVWTPAFERFVNTRQLWIESVKTPVHTAIRWFRKKLELEGVFGNDEYAMSLLAARIQQLNSDWFYIKSQVFGQLNFGTTYLEKYQDVAAALAPWMALTERTDRAIELFSLAPRFDTPKHLNHNYFGPQVLPVIAKAFSGHWKQHICDQVLDAVNKRSTVQHFHVLTTGSSEFEPPIPPTKLAQLNNFFENHKVMSLVATHSLREKIEFMEIMKLLARKYGLAAYGMLEYEHPEDWDSLKGKSLDAKTDCLDGFLCAEFKAMASKPSLDKLIPALSVSGGYQLNELTSALELLEEGVRMRHCVGGYHSKISTGNFKILALKKPATSQCLTLEASRATFGWKIVQAHGVLNREIIAHEQPAIATAIGALNLAYFLRRLPTQQRLMLVSVLTRCKAEKPLAYGLEKLEKYARFVKSKLTQVRYRIDFSLLGKREVCRTSYANPAHTFNLPTACWSRCLKEWGYVLGCRIKFVNFSREFRFAGKDSRVRYNPFLDPYDDLPF